MTEKEIKNEILKRVIKLCQNDEQFRLSIQDEVEKKYKNIYKLFLQKG